MGNHYKVINAKDFMISKPNGELDFDETKQLFIKMAETAKPPANY